jgi:hypothetical protein
MLGRVTLPSGDEVKFAVSLPDRIATYRKAFKWLLQLQSLLPLPFTKSIVRRCAALAYKRYRTWCSMFWRPKDLQKVRMDIHVSIVANTWLGLVP